MFWDLLKVNKICLKMQPLRIITCMLKGGVILCFCHEGWAATVTYNPKAKAEFDRFQRREDTLSLGVCNGCQLLALLGWVGEAEDGAGGGKKKSEIYFLFSSS